jgi:2-iminobutanoate/2-iminopropanoate deaminase
VRLGIRCAGSIFHSEREVLEKKTLYTGLAPKPIGPYSQAVLAGGFVFCSGQIPLDPATGKLVEGDIRIQARRILDNFAAVLAAAGTGLEGTVKLTVFLTDLKDFEALNSLLAEVFPRNPPARAVVQAAALPKGASVEMDLIAWKG